MSVCVCGAKNCRRRKTMDVVNNLVVGCSRCWFGALADRKWEIGITNGRILLKQKRQSQSRETVDAHISILYVDTFYMSAFVYIVHIVCLSFANTNQIVIRTKFKMQRRIIIVIEKGIAKRKKVYSSLLRFVKLFVFCLFVCVCVAPHSCLGSAGPHI